MLLAITLAALTKGSFTQASFKSPSQPSCRWMITSSPNYQRSDCWH